MRQSTSPTESEERTAASNKTNPCYINLLEDNQILRLPNYLKGHRHDVFADALVILNNDNNNNNNKIRKIHHF